MIKEKAGGDNEVPAKVMGPKGTKKITIKDFEI